MCPSNGFAVAAGIDPGKNGAVVVLASSGNILTAWQMPLLGAKGKKREYDLPAIVDVCRGLKAMHASALAESSRLRVAIEKQQPLPANMGGGIANFQRGYGLGIWEAALTALGLRYRVVPPKTWQRDMLDGVTGADTKAKAELQYMRMFDPGWAWPGKRTKRAHDGVIDAALIASYAWRQL